MIKLQKYFIKITFVFIFVFLFMMCFMTAVYADSSYTIRFNSNGGTGTMEDESMEYGVPKQLYANSYTRTGYTFAYWNTQSNGSGTSYSDEESVSNLASSGIVNLYAIWSKYPIIMKYTSNNEELDVDNNNNYLYQNIRETIDINVSASFVNQDKSTTWPTGKTVSVKLKQNGTVVGDSVSLSSNKTNVTFEDKLKYDDNIDLYNYSVEATDIENYTKEITGGATGGFVIKYTYDTKYSDLKVSKKIEGNMGDIEKAFNLSTPWGNHVGTQGKSRGPPGAITWAPRGNQVGPQG